MGTQVCLRRCNRLMAEPQRAHRAIDASLQKFHRTTQDKLCRFDYISITMNPGENEPIRHSPAFGIVSNGLTRYAGFVPGR
jgi:hypothetical protein